MDKINAILIYIDIFLVRFMIRANLVNHNHNRYSRVRSIYLCNNFYCIVAIYEC